MNFVEHIGIAVNNIESANELYTALLGVAPYKMETVDSEHVVTSFFQVGKNKIELLEATHENSAIAKFIAKKGEGIHHIAFDVNDIESEMTRLSNLGFQLLQEKPKRGADNKLVCFVHPKSAHGVLIELCQSIKDE